MLTERLQKLTEEVAGFQCDCDRCKSMCINTCMPTPEEALELITSKGEDKFIVYNYCGVESILPKRAENGRCIFQDSITKHCEIHNSKPIEGRLATHDTPFWLRDEVESLWDTEEGRALVEMFRRD